MLPAAFIVTSLTYTHHLFKADLKLHPLFPKRKKSSFVDAFIYLFIGTNEFVRT